MTSRPPGGRLPPGAVAGLRSGTPRSRGAFRSSDAALARHPEPIRLVPRRGWEVRSAGDGPARSGSRVGIEGPLARLRALLRTRGASGGTAPVAELGALRIAAREVSVDGRIVSLTRKEFERLALLARSAGEVIVQRQILGEISSEAHLSDTQYLRVYIAWIRQKLGDDPARPRFIRTEPGVGYRLPVPDEPPARA